MKLSKKLAKRLSKVFEKGIEKVIQREKDDPDYMPQSEFADSKTPCYDRADRMILDALPAVINTLALSIANHRVKKHAENHTEEVDLISKELTPEQIDVSTRHWWRL